MTETWVERVNREQSEEAGEPVACWYHREYDATTAATVGEGRGARSVPVCDGCAAQIRQGL